MPEETGKLTGEERAKALEWLEKKISKPCEACENDDWFLADSIVASVNMNMSGIIFGGELLPCFCAICKNCGNTRFFNAVLSGVYQQN